MRHSSHRLHPYAAGIDRHTLILLPRRPNEPRSSMWSFLFFFFLHVNIFESSYHRYYCHGQPQVEEVDLSQCVLPPDGASHSLTPADALGPFYQPNSISSHRLGPEALLNDPAQRLHLSGTVFHRHNATCVLPLPDIVLELWYAGPPDAPGNYYQEAEYRGSVVTDAQGRYNVTQVFPALYPMRPILHNHLRLSKLQDGQELLVTQMYFLGSETGYRSEDTLQAVALQTSTDGARYAEFHIYLELDDFSTANSGGEDHSVTTSRAFSMMKNQRRFSSRDYYVWSQGTMSLMLGLLGSSLWL